ncbi:MAG TPA: ATP-grasp domain-containing protein [Pyrinomonadaceae bacterium]|nr:ATP-grasp domain-containing protein [Pyrinomonadaceae bacterium]
MTNSEMPTILCIASFFKGNDFIRECKRRGAAVVLLTREKLLDAEWARDSLEDLIAIPGKTSVQSYLAAATYVARQRRVVRMVALEEYDIVTAAHIREHLCVPGMGVTIARSFQDKLAMRCKANEVAIQQPKFVPLVNYDEVDQFMKQTSPPWMLKPRIGASSMGMKKLHDPDAVWRAVADLDTREQFHERSDFHLLEQFVPGDVYHVDSLVAGGKVLFATVERYGAPPFDVSHSGGVPISYFVKYGSREERALLALNKKLLNGFGFQQGVTHAEFIHRAASAVYPNEQFIFLEVAARVGGAYTADTIAAATGINLWSEWADIELATPGRPYILPPLRKEYGGIAVSLARQENPCTCRYDDPEIVYRVSKPWHVGLIVRSPDQGRVVSLLTEYAKRFREDFTAVAPAEESAEQHL